MVKKRKNILDISKEKTIDKRITDYGNARNIPNILGKCTQKRPRSANCGAAAGGKAGKLRGDGSKGSGRKLRKVNADGK